MSDHVKRKVYLDQAVCPIGHEFPIQRRTSSMGKYVSTWCPRCNKHFRGYAGVVVSLKKLQKAMGRGL